ncbi:MAG: anti-sigma factor domain-containing protein [Janthinobacterium lividum]
MSPRREPENPVPEMSEEDPLLAGAWALDALDHDERTAYERRLRRFPVERAEADELRETAALLGAATAATPPDRVRISVLAAIADTPQESPAPPIISELEVARHRRAGRAQRRPAHGGPALGGPALGGPARGKWARWSVLVAAAAVVVAGVGIGVGLDARRDADQARTQAAAEIARQREVTDLLTAPGSSVVTVAGRSGGSATVVRRGSQAAVLTAALPAVGAGQTYQLWLVTGDVATSAGLLDPTAAGASTTFVADTHGAGAIGISVEPAGGSQAPTTTPVVVAPLGA